MKYITYNFDRNAKQLSNLFPLWQHNIDYISKEDVVIFNNDIYLCISNHNSGTVFDASKWMCINKEQGSVKYAEINVALTGITSTYQIPSNVTVMDIKINVINGYDNGISMNIGINNIDNTLLATQDVSYSGIYTFNILNKVTNGGNVNISFNGISTKGNATIYISYVDSFLN